MTSRSLCILGTDTDVGKTIVTGLLYRYLFEQHVTVTTQKWLQCGEPYDIESHNQWVPDGLNQTDARRCVYTFPLPASPHLAAQDAGISIDIGHIIRSWRSLSDNYNCLLIEGSGGVYVPLNTNTTFIDLLVATAIPTVIVVANKLGCINHSLLTAHALQTHGVSCLGLIFNQSTPSSPSVIQKDNPGIITTLSHLPVLGSLPFSDDKDTLIKDFRPIGDQLLCQLV